MWVFKNVLANCEHWSVRGECAKNPLYMLKACKSQCEEFKKRVELYQKKCPQRDFEDALQPNALKEKFQGALKLQADAELVSSDPPIIVFDNFINDKEADVFVKHGNDNTYERSTGLDYDADGNYRALKTSIRTSSNTWCHTRSCLEDDHIINVTRRISDLVNVSDANFEYAQLLYYHACRNDDAEELCSFYKKHHDYIPSDRFCNQGVRMMTMLIYLNNVTKGGETVFDAGISITPQKGRAVLWPNVLSASPHEEDTRTYHEAQPVFSGSKYAVNFWIHQRNFKVPHSMNCIHH